MWIQTGVSTYLHRVSGSVQHDLYHLIAGLGRAEKAYFKKFGLKYGSVSDRKEALLFDAVNKLLKASHPIDDAFDARVRAAVRRAGSSAFSAAKKNLFEALLRSLADYDRASSRDARRAQRYAEINALVKRQAVRPALRMLRRSIAEMEEREEFHWLLLFRTLEARLLIARNEPEAIRTCYVATRRDLDALGDLLTVRELFERTFQIHREMGRSEQSLERDDVRELLTIHDEMDRTDRSATWTLNVLSWNKTLGYIVGDDERVRSTLSQMVEVAEEHPWLFDDREQVRVAIYADMIYHDLEAGSDEAFRNLFPVLRDELVSKVPSVEAYRRQQVVRVLAMWSHRVLDYEALWERFDDFRAEVQTMSPHTANGLFVDFVTAAFATGRSRELVLLVEEHRTLLKTTEPRADLLILNELVLLAMHLRDGDLDVLETGLRSFKRRFDHAELSPSARALRDVFTAVRGEGYGDRRSIARAARRALDAEGEQSVFGAFDVRAFLRMIEEDVEYVEAVRRERGGG